MGGYLIKFAMYTLAMIGVLFGALFVFKTFSSKCFSKKSTMLDIEDSMNLSPRKTLYVVKADNQRFLIAADTDRTTLISKLEKEIVENVKPTPREDKSSTLTSFDGVASLTEFTSLDEFKKLKEDKEPMMKGLARKLSVR